MQVLLLPYPPPVNAIWSPIIRTTGTGKQFANLVRSKRYREWLEEGIAMLGRQDIEKHEGAVSVEFAVGRPDKRKRDIDGIVKPCLDLLQQAGVYDDDAQVHRLVAYWSTEVTGVQCEIMEYAAA